MHSVPHSISGNAVSARQTSRCVKQTGRMRWLASFMVLLPPVLAWCSVGCNAHNSDPKEFAAISIRVIDKTTMQPVVGATVSPLCMGGTPYETNIYRTDSQGNVNVMFYKSSPGVVVEITRDGYETAHLSAPIKDAVLSLEKAQRNEPKA